MVVGVVMYVAREFQWSSTWRNFSTTTSAPIADMNGLISASKSTRKVSKTNPSLTGHRRLGPRGNRDNSRPYHVLWLLVGNLQPLRTLAIRGLIIADQCPEIR